MRRAFKIITATIAVFFIAGPIVLVFAEREVVSCSLIDYVGLDLLAPGIFVSPDMSSAEKKELIRIQQVARARVEQTFGPLRAKPVFVATGNTNTLKRYFSNEYASTAFTPTRACIVIGPKGHEVDIVAHELVHAEIFERVGYWRRLIEIPVWFDEGVAMQVDYRERYTRAQYVGVAEHIKEVRKLEFGRQFFRGDDEELTHHYAMAKEEVRLWLSKVGHRRLYAANRPQLNKAVCSYAVRPLLCAP